MDDNVSEPDEAEFWWFCWRQKIPAGGHWITQGPFNDYERAKSERESSKAWDAEVGNVFKATKKVAEERCSSGQVG